MKTRKNNLFHLVRLVLALLILVSGFLLLNRDSDATTEGEGFDSERKLSTESFFPNRQAGWVSLELIQTSLNETGFSRRVTITPDGDEVKITTSRSYMLDFRTVFYGQRSEVYWEEKFDNLPIEFIDEGNEFGFIAEMKRVGDKNYIHVPYEIVNSLVNYID